MVARKRGSLLMENFVFIALNLIFLTLLILFLIKQGQGAVVLEQTYAKEVALLIDSAKPETTMLLNIEKGKKIAEKNNVDIEEIIEIDSENHIVTAKLSEKGGYSYSFFNDVDATAYPDKTNPQEIVNYVIKVNSYNHE